MIVIKNRRAAALCELNPLEERPPSHRERLCILMTAIRACKSEDAFVFSDAVKEAKRCAHTTTHSNALQDE